MPRTEEAAGIRRATEISVSRARNACQSRLRSSGWKRPLTEGIVTATVRLRQLRNALVCPVKLAQRAPEEVRLRSPELRASYGETAFACLGLASGTSAAKPRREPDFARSAGFVEAAFACRRALSPA